MDHDPARLEAGRKIIAELGFSRTNAPTAMDEEFFNHTLAELFGTLFPRPHLTLREREMITLAVIIAVGGTIDNMRPHFNALAKFGFSEDQIREIIIQTMYYAGWPKGAAANINWGKIKAENAEAAKNVTPR